MRSGFRFRWIPLGAMLIVAAIGIALGNWQTRRAEEKTELQQQMLARAAQPALSANTLTATEKPEAFRRITAEGEFISRWAVYLDNRPLEGKAGFYLLMPMKLAGTDQAVLVMRGWFPRDTINRTKIPELPVPSAPVRIEGRARLSTGKLMQLGEAPPLEPGSIVQNASIAEFSEASKLSLQTFIIEQTSAANDSLVRDWPLPSTGIDTHRGYAFQWYALSAAAIIFFLVTGFKRASKRNDPA